MHVFHGTLKEELLHLKSDRLEKTGTVIYMCTDQWTGQWLIQAIYGHRLREGPALKEMDIRNLAKPLTMLLGLDPRLHSEKCRVLDKYEEPKDQRLILLVHQDVVKANLEIGYKIYTISPLINDPKV
jgi:hypothetical protein